MKIFIEEQKITQLWLHILLIICCVVVIAAIAEEYVAYKGDTNDAWVAPLVGAGSMVLVYAFIFLLKLKTRIDEKGISYQFSPFHFKIKTISWDTIQKCYVRKYSPITEYGGWGYRAGLGRRNGKAYNVKGAIGLQIETKEGKKVLLGTQKEEEVKSVLQTYAAKITMKIKILIVIILYTAVAFSQVTSEEILLKNDSIALAGTLTYTKKGTLLLIWVHGSGNVDRNGNQAGANVKANYIKQFRDRMNKNDLAFYSFDKRTANPKNKQHLSNTLFDDFVADLRIVVNHFKDDIRFSGIVLIGHSQGSLTALLASQHIKKYISLAGPSKSIDDTIEVQVAKNSPMVLDTVKGHFKELRETGDISYVNPLLMQIFSKRNLPFLKSWMRYSPIEEIKKLTIPILVVNGTKDLQVTVQDAKELHKANPKAELVIIENMNHVLKNIKNSADNLKSYYAPEFSLSEKLIETVITFVKK